LSARPAARWSKGTEALPIRVRLGDALRSDAAAIADLGILPAGAAAHAATGAYPALPLSAIAEMRLEPGEGTITRRNGERVNTVQAFLLRGVLPEEALASVQAEMAALHNDIAGVCLGDEGLLCGAKLFQRIGGGEHRAGSHRLDVADEVRHHLEVDHGRAGEGQVAQVEACAGRA
jgi:hypothetical protein